MRHRSGSIAVCVDELPVTGAAISLVAGDERQEPVFATDHVAGELDELQFRLGEGPSVEASTRCRPVQVTDLADISDSRWPMFAVAARRTPARGMYVFPLHAGTTGVGVLALYHVEPGVLPTSDMGTALCVADAAFWALLGLLSAATPDRGKAKTVAAPRDWLTGAPLYRTEVYQATGMIIAQLDVSAENALARLRAHAFVHGPSLAEVARDVVTRRLRFDKEEK